MNNVQSGTSTMTNKHLKVNKNEVVLKRTSQKSQLGQEKSVIHYRKKEITFEIVGS